MMLLLIPVQSTLAVTGDRQELYLCIVPDIIIRCIKYDNVRLYLVKQWKACRHYYWGNRLELSLKLCFYYTVVFDAASKENQVRWNELNENRLGVLSQNCFCNVVCHQFPCYWCLLASVYHELKECHKLRFMENHMRYESVTKEVVRLFYYFRTMQSPCYYC